MAAFDYDREALKLRNCSQFTSNEKTLYKKTVSPGCIVELFADDIGRVRAIVSDSGRVIAGLVGEHDNTLKHAHALTEADYRQFIPQLIALVYIETRRQLRE